MASVDFLFDSKDIAGYIVWKCAENGFLCNNTKTQKLLYCCYGTVLAQFEQRLCNEYPRAWQYGPVFPSVFRFIDKHKDEMLFGLTEQAKNARTKFANPEMQPVQQMVDNTIQYFGKYSAKDLSEWSHTAGSPWDTVVRKHVGEMYDFIPDDLIFKYFNEKVLEEEDEAKSA